MACVITQPEVLAAAGIWQGIGTSAQNAAAAGPTTGVLTTAAGEVSALTAPQFGLVLMIGLAATVAGYLCSLMRSQIPRLPMYSSLSRRRQFSAVSVLPLFQTDRKGGA